MDGQAYRKCAAIKKTYRKIFPQGIRIMKRKILALTVCLFVAVAPVSAQAGLLEFLFPMLKKKEVDPALTLKAPFAEDAPKEYSVFDLDQPVKIEPGKIQPLPENSIPLERPHRSAVQVGEWVAAQTAAMLTFENEDYNKDIEATAPFFDTAGREQYLKFLQDFSIIKALEVKRYAVRSFIKDPPLLLSEGAAAGRYHWLYQVTVTMSYLDKTSKDYKHAKATNYPLTIKIQVGRSASAKDPSGLVVEHWSGKVVQAQQPKAKP